MLEATRPRAAQKPCLSAIRKLLILRGGIRRISLPTNRCFWALERKFHVIDCLPRSDPSGAKKPIGANSLQSTDSEHRVVLWQMNGENGQLCSSSWSVQRLHFCRIERSKSSLTPVSSTITAMTLAHVYSRFQLLVKPPTHRPTTK